MKIMRSFNSAWPPIHEWAMSSKARADCARFVGQYPGKGVKDDLTPAEKKTLRKLNRDW